MQVTIESLIFEMQECKVLTFVDMTNLKRLIEIERENLNLQLRESSVSHELIAPLRCISQLSADLMNAPSQKVREKSF